ncbi:2-amino-4-hydroxy-6-hydroxymethyldihydropteridinediphosphokinase [Caloramator quimbayensis]|uniref:2-amino-4-hydroxy-6-hydroxymethyldihydropteridine diphosphokinase n=1 Tax=Caloramator quimbayensis TaxID=1147123 RepID=A0A1T4YEV5_9CLOT|nr:2-amino-4-hydroxy-6-hydroxymethyldihydropteridine diphosphokinase [Caloramator quimbayensis]SKB00233.1 2-amino-4-hydroxy-6-hydroxymethyldihydropteridinediphosphokinase [Caloramator quimbayensis]
MNKVYVAFGTNMGDKNENIKKAIETMKDRGLNVIKISEIYKTEPYGYTNQPEFLNGVLEALTDLEAVDVLNTLLNIEKDMGRVRKFKWGPRIIDLDILFFNDDVIDEKDLKVPHPDMQNREFVLKPLCEIAPDFMHPVLKKSVRDMLLELELKTNKEG